MVLMILLPFLVIGNFFLVRSLERNEMRLILFSSILIGLLIIISRLLHIEIFEVWLFSLFIYPYHYLNKVINKLMGHEVEDPGTVKKVQKFLRIRLFYGLLMFYQVFMTISLY